MTGETITSTAPDSAAQRRSSATAFTGGAVIGALGGLIGLGGAEFRLPLLIGAFRFAALQAVILNKSMSLVVVASALPFRAATVPLASVAANWPIIVNLLAGSLLGAWFGAGWATRLASQALYRVIAVLLLAAARSGRALTMPVLAEHSPTPYAGQQRRFVAMAIRSLRCTIITADHPSRA